MRCAVVDALACEPAEHLEGLAALPARDTRRRHLDACLACQVTLLLVREFRSPRRRRGELDLVVDERLRALVRAIVSASPA